jgi:hypothetical protein
MTTYSAPNRTYDAGVPAQWSDDFAVTPEGLITGEYPAQFVQDLPTAFSQTLTAGMVVGVNGTGEVVQATTSIKPIGVLMYNVTTGASGDKLVARVLRSACINPDRLTWHSTFDTDAKKMAAFEGSASPTQIVLRKLAHYTPVAP